jgi:hypothetical protein
MALLEDAFGNGVGGPAAVVGAVLLGSLLLPAVAGAARRVVKTAIKGVSWLTGSGARRWPESARS